jgi:HAD superfamily hydrolase (TIGR01509 family)
MDHYFQKVVSCLDVAKPKPDPEGVQLILSAMSTEPDQAVYVGDAETDAATAETGGIHFVSYKNRGLTADAHIDHFDQLAAVVESL